MMTLMEAKMQAATIKLFLPNGETGACGAEVRGRNEECIS
jgi:hypothetical protein